MKTSIGRNGSGKSALIDAIEWCLFRRRASNLRVKKVDQLVNSNQNGDLVINVELRKNNESLHISRKFNGKSVSIGARSVHGEESEKVKPEELDEVLGIKFGIDVKNVDRILIKQSSAAIACTSSSLLLSFLENVTGTFELEIQTKECREKVIEFGKMLAQENINISTIKQKTNEIKPRVETIHQWMRNKRKLCYAWVHYYTTKATNIDLRAQECTIALNTITSSLTSATAAVLAMTHSLDQIQHESIDIDATYLKRKNIIIRVRKQFDSMGDKARDMDTDIKSSLKDTKKLEKQIADLRTKIANFLTAVQKETAGQKDFDIKIHKCDTNLNTNRLCMESLTKGHTSGHIRAVKDLILQARAVMDQYSDTSGPLHALQESIRAKEQLKSQSAVFEENIRQHNSSVQISLKTVEEALLVEKHSLSEAQIYLHNLDQTMEQKRVRISEVILQIGAINRREYAAKQFGDTSRFLQQGRQLVASLAVGDGQKCQVFGLLCDLIRPLKDDVIAPITTVLGGGLFKTFIVATRSDAIELARRCQQVNISNVTIDIIDEVDDRISQQYMRTHMPRNRDSFVPLVDCLVATNTIIMPVIRKRLHRWCLFRGAYSEALAAIGTLSGVSGGTSSRKPANKPNYVSLDGYRFYGDGEIRSSDGPSGSQALYSWPADAAGDKCPVETSDNCGVAATLQDLVAEQRVLEDALTALRINQEAAASDASAGRNRVSELEDSIASFKSQLRYLPATAMFTPSDESALRKELAQLKTLLSQSANASDNLQSTLRSISGSHSIDALRFHTLLLEEETLRGTRRSLELQKRIAAKELVARKQRCAKAETSLLRLTEQLSSLATKHGSLILQRRQVEERRQMLGEDLSMQDAHMSPLTSAVSVLSARLKEAKSKHRALTASEASLKRSSDEKRQRLVALRSQSTDNELQLSTAKEALEEILGRMLEAGVDLGDESADADAMDIDTPELKPRRRTGKHQRTADNAEVSGTREDESLSLDMRERQLKLLAKELGEMEATLEFVLLDTYKALQCELSEKEAATAAAQREATALQVQANKLQLRRFDLLMDHLRQINHNLTSCYPQLVPGGGCFLSFPTDPISLFQEGVTLMAQHGNQPWRETGKLSGGQQAAGSLAMLLAIQDCFPSPLYIMDEVDAALDTYTSARVGGLLREKAISSGTQFILVSHRPELHIYASRVVGLYLFNGSPSCVSQCFSTISTTSY